MVNPISNRNQITSSSTASANTDNSLLKKFYNLPISQKQTIALIACQLVSVIGIGIGGTLITFQGLRSQLLEQAKSELAVTNIAYNIKINQMGFGFRGQADNPAIIKAAIAYNSGLAVNPGLKAEVKGILFNEIIARKIEFATLVGRDSKIVVNANNDRTGEIFNPDNLVSEVFANPQQIKATRTIKWADLEKEGATLPNGFQNQDALIRYTVTPVRDTANKTVVGALVSGDIVNGKTVIPAETIKATNGGYSGIYYRQTDGKLALASSLQTPTSGDTRQSIPGITLGEAGQKLLDAASRNNGQIVTGRLQIGNQSYTVAAQAVPSKITQAGDEIRMDYDKEPSGILVRGTPEVGINNLLRQSILEQILVVIIALVLIAIWNSILRRGITQPIKNLQKTAQQFSQNISNQKGSNFSNIQAEVFANDEIGELATCFNTMADCIREQFQYQKSETDLALKLNQITGEMRESLQRDRILKSAVTNTREALAASRVLFYQLDENYQGRIISESVDYQSIASFGELIDNPYDIRDKIAELTPETLEIVRDIHQSKLSATSIAQLEKSQVKAYMLAPVFANQKLQGLFVIQECKQPRTWQELEINLCTQVATQIGYALEQADLLQQIEQSRKTAEKMSQSEREQKETLQLQLLELLSDVEGAASGDLTVRADVRDGEIGTVADFFNSIVESLRDIVTQVKSTAVQVNQAIGDNSIAIRQLAEDAIAQTQEIEQTLNAVDGMTTTMHAIAQNAQQAATVVEIAAQNAQASGEAMDLTVQKIMFLRESIGETAKKTKRLGESTQQITRVVSLINQISQQTNLLAINAGIEAARAGEEAHGFAVVAEEVGELAARCSFATREIEHLVENIQTETNELAQAMESGTTYIVEGTQVLEDTKHKLKEIIQISDQVDQLVQSISQATQSQVHTSQAIAELMKQIVTASQRTSTSSHQVSQSLQQTVAISQKLQTTVETFRVD
ncbi:methyl-accepting chemotaxis protein [Calothrix sp. NIES-3974]|uniref:methyl-accepting chemotaxis protein n=1 Tax=Calothrix sp. NIES-3974 TaxID=2005462 RepID=UPI000B601E4A|nr:methyl-accepting chemotaxis protein [Calothrix sp. NIES-3974]BAZ07278.1 methyl-accepting chemotaxis protein [Calothrix sp. NIES-3974]